MQSCGCENAQCDHGDFDHFTMCKRPAGNGRVQWLGYVCDKCYEGYSMYPDLTRLIWPDNRLNPDIRYLTFSNQYRPSDYSHWKRRRMTGWGTLRSPNFDNKMSFHRLAFGCEVEDIAYPFNKLGQPDWSE